MPGGVAAADARHELERAEHDVDGGSNDVQDDRNGRGEEAHVLRRDVHANASVTRRYPPASSGIAISSRIRTTGSRDDRRPTGFALTAGARGRRLLSAIGAESTRRGRHSRGGSAAASTGARAPRLRLASVHGAVGAALELNACVRQRAKVQPPGGILLAPAVHGQGHEVRAVLDVADDRGSLGARSATDRLQTQEAELAAVAARLREADAGRR